MKRTRSIANPNEARAASDGNTGATAIGAMWT
jgi:hypothetical protein